MNIGNFTTESADESLDSFDDEMFNSVADQLKMVFPLDTEHVHRKTLAKSLYVTVQLVGMISKLLAPNGMRCSINGPGGDYKVSIMRPEAEKTDEDAFISAKFKIRKLRSKLFEERARWWQLHENSCRAYLSEFASEKIESELKIAIHRAARFRSIAHKIKIGTM